MLNFKKILIVFTGIIVVLHSAIPHQHNTAFSEDSISTTKESNTILDFISLALHLNLGENHLENFMTLEEVSEEGIEDVHFPVFNQEFSVSKTTVFTPNSIIFCTNFEYLVAENIKFTNQFRGPPSIMS